MVGPNWRSALQQHEDCNHTPSIFQLIWLEVSVALLGTDKWPPTTIRPTSARMVWKTSIYPLFGEAIENRSTDSKLIPLPLQVRCGLYCVDDGLQGCCRAARAGSSNRHRQDQSFEAAMQPRRAAARIECPRFACGIAICVFQIHSDVEITSVRVSSPTVYGARALQRQSAR